VALFGWVGPWHGGLHDEQHYVQEADQEPEMESDSKPSPVACVLNSANYVNQKRKLPKKRRSVPTPDHRPPRDIIGGEGECGGL
jgi:hypothetical protein